MQITLFVVVKRGNPIQKIASKFRCARNDGDEKILKNPDSDNSRTISV